MTTTNATDRFTELPDDQTIADTVVALEEHGFSVEVVDDLDAARETVLARIPEGSSVMTNPSVTLQETGIRGAIDDGGPYDSARNKLNELDFADQRHPRRWRAEARLDCGSGTRADLRVQPAARGRSRVCSLRAEQLRRQDPRDPPGVPGPHPRRPHPAGGRVLIAANTWSYSVLH